MTYQYEKGLIRTDRGLFIDKGNQVFDVRHPDFAGGAKGDGVTDDTAAIQAAIDAATPAWESTSPFGRVLIPLGRYKVTQLTLRDNTWIEGVSFVGFGNMYGSRLEQISGTEGPMFIMEPRAQVTSTQYIAHLILRDLFLIGDGVTAGNHGIAFERADGTPVSPQDICAIENLHVRRFGGDGIYLPNAAVPLKVGPHIFIHECGGAGLRIEHTAVAAESIHLDSISGDANADGLIVVDGLAASDTIPCTLLMTNIKGERRTNNYYSAGECPDDLIVLNNCTNLPVIIDGANFHVISTGTSNPRSTVNISGTTRPKLWFRGLTTTLRSGLSGTPASINDAISSVTVPRDVHSGYYGAATTHVEAAQSGTHRRVFGGPVQDWLGDSDAMSPAFMIAGALPGFALYETDQATDEKAWQVRASGGVLEVRTRADDGTTGQSFIELRRSGNTRAYGTLLGPWARPQNNFNANDATPSVSGGSYFRTANTNPTTITGFDDGVTGQEVIVEINDANTTIDFTGTTLKGNGGSDWSPTTGDHMRCFYNGTNWLCEISDNTA